MKIITDVKALNTHVTASLKTYASVGTRLHIDVVSAIWHACSHGNPAILNRIHANLRSNDQTALKMYLRRIQVINGLPKHGDPEGLSQEASNQAMLDGSIFGFAKGEYTVINGHTSKQAKSLKALCEKRFVNPDGKIDRMVFDRNNFAEVKHFNDEKVVADILSLVKKAGKDTDTRKNRLSDGMKKFLEDMETTLETRKAQLELAA